MAKETIQPQQNEDIDLGQLFKAIGRMFDNLINFIGRIFKGLLGIIVFLSKAVIENIWIIVSAVVIAGLSGFGLEKMRPPIYESKLIVRTNFDAKYQLGTNLNYYNALLADQRYDALEEIFEIEEEDLKNILSFELIPGPESENDRLVAYQNFVSRLDSIYALELSFEDFLENRSVYSGNIFEIRVLSEDRGIFNRLENGIFNTMQNGYALKKKIQRDSLLALRKRNINEVLKKIDSLKQVYLNVIQEQSRSNATKINLPGVIPLQEETQQTYEFELLNKEILLKDELSKLDEVKVEQDEFFEIVSGFQVYGNKVLELKDRYTIILPALALLLLAIGFLVKIYVQFVRSYKNED